MQEMEKRGKRKVKEGVVVSNKMQKTVRVRVGRTFRHPDFDKVITRESTYFAHIEDQNSVAVGQRVVIEETRPLSKLKRWRVLQVKEVK